MPPRMSTTHIDYEVDVPGFEGPLDLLLRLVEQNHLPVTEVSLAQVTDSYIRRIQSMEVPPEEMSHFLVVASRLVLLKSRYLLPRPEPRESEPTADELAEQLRTFQRFKAAAARLRETEARICYAQLAPPSLPDRTSQPVSLPATLLHRALSRSSDRNRHSPDTGENVRRARLRLADAVARAEALMKQDGMVTLEKLAGDNPGRLELIVAFLAALDLVRRRRAVPVQEAMFGPMALYPAEETN